MKTTFPLFVFFLAFNLLSAQTTIADADLSLLPPASEGDHYTGVPSGIIYIGLASGAYQPFDTNIYKTNGELSDNRLVTGNNFDLHFSNLNTFRTNATSSSLYATTDTQINTTAGYTQLWGSSGIILYDATTFESSIWPKAGIKDTSGDFGTAGQVLSSTVTGTNWISNNSSITTPVEGTGLILAINTYTANSDLTTTLTPDHYTIILKGAKEHTLVLPSAAGNIGLVYNIKNLGDKDATINLYIDYQGQDIYRVQKQKMLVLQSDGTNWQQIN
ncbi:MAG: hypothetical protein COB81_01470 [Flavobacteriaceae bacterium]|nr:MAG: hypothetical protein COB81_01470 [Flavobacteriaceae bacterium]